jgi:hypothetical protein
MTHHDSMHSGTGSNDITDPTGEHSILRDIREGMDVFDSNNNRIGSVEFVHFGAASGVDQELGTGPATVTPADDPQMRRDTFIDNIAEAFYPTDVPDVVRNKLLLNGYVRLDAAGLFAADRYIMPEQIAGITSDGVRLNVTRDELFKPRM